MITGDMVRFNFPYIMEPEVGWGIRVGWQPVSIPKSRAEDLLIEMAADLGYRVDRVNEIAVELEIPNE